MSDAVRVSECRSGSVRMARELEYRDHHGARGGNGMSTGKITRISSHLIKRVKENRRNIPND